MIGIARAGLMLLLAGTAGAATACETGLYRDAGGRAVIVTDNAPLGKPANPRWTLLDGRRGDVTAPDSPVRCETGGLRARSGAALRREAVRETPTHFHNIDVDFYGVLFEPDDGQAKHPLVVMVAGSENRSNIGTSYPYVFLAQGISTFVYDKRGVGGSGGFYNQSFRLLGDDAAAAGREARRLAAGRVTRWGYFGGSQGGWVAPAAAALGGADFVEVGFGLALSPLEEDSEQVYDELRRKGYGADVIAKAHEVTTATDAVVASHFASGYEGLRAIKARYGGEAWFKGIEGEFTGDVLRADETELRTTGRARLDGLAIDWSYDAVAVLKSLKMPQLWVQAGSDREAPPALTHERLLALKKAGAPIDLYSFPDTDHGITEYVEKPDGTRTTIRVTDGYYRLLGDWIKGKAGGPYGRGRKLD